jgi:hypothetical protein
MVEPLEIVEPIANGEEPEVTAALAADCVVCEPEELDAVNATLSFTKLVSHGDGSTLFRIIDRKFATG